MRRGGGKQMQAISNRYTQKVEINECKPADRYDLRVKLAHQVTHNVTVLNAKLCRALIKDIYGKDKR